MVRTVQVLIVDDSATVRQRAGASPLSAWSLLLSFRSLSLRVAPTPVAFRAITTFCEVTTLCWGR